MDWKPEHTFLAFALYFLTPEEERRELDKESHEHVKFLADRTGRHASSARLKMMNVIGVITKGSEDEWGFYDKASTADKLIWERSGHILRSISDEFQAVLDERKFAEDLDQWKAKNR